MTGTYVASGIYTIRNDEDGKIYVGSSRNVSHRLTQHRRDLRRNKHHSRFLQCAWNKFGEHHFHFEPVLYCSESALLIWEQIAIDGLMQVLGWSNMYNSSTTAHSSKWSDESKERIRKSLTGRSIPDDVRRKISDSLRGRPRPSEVRQKIAKGQLSDRAKNMKRRAVGEFKHTQESKSKLSAALVGRKLPEKTKLRMSESRSGRHTKWSDEARKRRSIAMKGKINPLLLDARRRASGSSFSRTSPRSAESNKKRSETMKTKDFSWLRKS